jgi:hypothetical protein
VSHACVNLFSEVHNLCVTSDASLCRHSETGPLSEHAESKGARPYPIESPFDSASSAPLRAPCASQRTVGFA